MSREAAKALRTAKATAPRRGRDEPLFFGTRSGDRLTRHTISHAVPRVVVAAGLDRLTPHGFRHGAATLMVARGAHIRVVAEQLGHKSANVTLRTYAHVVPSQQVDAIRLLDRAEPSRLHVEG